MSNGRQSPNGRVGELRYEGRWGRQAVQADAVTTIHAGWRLREMSVLQMQAVLGRQASPGLFWNGHMDMRDTLLYPRELQGLVKL